MDASSKGVESHPVKLWDRRKKKWIFQRGNVFKRLEMNGIDRENQIWWIAKEYLRRLGPKFFEEISLRSSRSTLSFRVFLTTNLKDHKEVIPAPRDAADVIFRRSVKNKREMIDRMTWQLVQSIMKCLYADGRYQSGSLTSSAIWFQEKSNRSMSIGKTSIKTQNFKLAFTLILDLD